MLNPKTNERELAYIVSISWVRPIEGADNIELVGINGWTCIAKKGEFKENDFAVYFEIDSKLPPADWSDFMASKHYKVKTMKLNKFKVISQGLALPISVFGWKVVEVEELDGKHYLEVQDEEDNLYKTGDFLTKKLGVIYSVEEDNTRKGSGPDKYKKMAQRHGKLFSKPLFRWLMHREWGKKLLFVFFGKKKDKRTWLPWVVKTDEERVQNMPWILENKCEWFATEKIDGTSTTFTMQRPKRFAKPELYVCSRNVVFDVPDKNCFYDTNVYMEMAEKYNIKEILIDILEKNPQLAFVTLQGETYGDSIQKRTYNLKDHQFMAFNLIYGYPDGNTVRMNPRAMTDALTPYNVPCVPIVNEHFILPDTVEELLAIATGKSKIDGGMREGLVFRSADGVKSFKAVSNEFLLKYHNG